MKLRLRLALLLFSDTTDARPGAVIDVGGAAESCRETSPVGFGSGCVDVLPALKYAGVLLEPGLITRSKTTPSSAYRGGSPAAPAAEGFPTARLHVLENASSRGKASKCISLMGVKRGHAGTTKTTA